MKTKNKLIASLTICASIMFSVAFAPHEVSASTGAGGGDAGTVAGNGMWYKIYGKEGTQNAWNEFLAKTTNNNWANPAAKVAESGNKFGNPKLTSQCRDSRYIWYTVMDRYSFEWASGAENSHQWTWINGHPKDTNPKDWQGYRDWDKANTWGSGKTIIICSGSYEELTKDCSYDEHREKTNTDTIEGVYATNTTLSPNTRVEYASYTAEKRKEWDNEHESQQTDPEKSKFGEWYDANINEIDKLKHLKGEAYKQQLAKIKKGAEEAKKGDYIKHPTIKMSEKNQKGFAKGGVYTLSEGERTAKITVSTKTKETRRVTCKQEKQPDGTWGPEKKTYGPWKETDTLQDKPTTNQLTSMTPKRFWQLIHAICNEEGMNAVQGATQTTVISGGDDISKTLQTKQYTTMSELPLSNPNNSNGSLSNTAHEDFYDSKKGCPVPPSYGLECVSDPNGTTYKSDKGTLAKQNVQDKGTQVNNKYGAQGTVINKNDKPEQMSGDEFTFFRNNKDNDIRLDVWYPKATGNRFDNKDTGTLYSEIHFDPNGTPIADDMVHAVYGKAEFTGDDIKNGSGKLIQEGEVNKLTVRGAWASDDDKKHKANASWIYQVNFKANIPTDININQTGNSSQVAVPTKFGCKMNMNTTSSDTPYAIGGMLDQSNPMQEGFNDEANKHVDFGFVRAGSGLNQH